MTDRAQEILNEARVASGWGVGEFSTSPERWLAARCAALEAELADTLRFEQEARNATAREKVAHQKSLSALAGMREALANAVGVIQWMSGSPSFAPEGEAHKGWIKARSELAKWAALAANEDTDAHS